MLLYHSPSFLYFCLTFSLLSPLFISSLFPLLSFFSHFSFPLSCFLFLLSPPSRFSSTFSSPFSSSFPLLFFLLSSLLALASSSLRKCHVRPKVRVTIDGAPARPTSDITGATRHVGTTAEEADVSLAFARHKSDVRRWGNFA